MVDQARSGGMRRPEPRPEPRPRAALARTPQTIAALNAYADQLLAFIANNPSSPLVPTKQIELDAVMAKIAQLKSSATKTPDKSDHTKQYYQDGSQAPKRGVPLGEWQP